MMRSTSRYLSLAFFVVIVGFLFILSKVPWLLIPGILLVFGGLLTPFYKDLLTKGFHRISGKPSKLESMLSSEDFGSSMNGGSLEGVKSRKVTGERAMRTTSSYLSLAFLAVIVGFLFILSKVPWLLVPGILLVFGGLLTPFYKDLLTKGFHRISGKPENLRPVSLRETENVIGASGDLSLAFLAVIVGFLFILSKVPWLLVPGILLVFGGLLTPFYKDLLTKGFHRIDGKPEKPELAESINKKDSTTSGDPVGNGEAEQVASGSVPSQNLSSEIKSLVSGPADVLRSYLSGANLRELNLVGADLRQLDLSGANLSRMNLSKVNFSKANLSKVDLSGADLRGADLSWVDLHGANLSWAICERANFSGSNLSGAVLLGTDLKDADLTGCFVYGISASDARLEGATQTNLIITPPDEPTITVDNLKVAQFVSLLLNSREICDLINTFAVKVVLILGHFNSKREIILKALKDELRRKDYLPVVFDLNKPSSRDLTEEIFALAHMSRFIIADIENPERFSSKLQHIIPSLPRIPIQPLIESSTQGYNLFEQFEPYPWFLKVFRYKDAADLLGSLEKHVIEPPENYYRKTQDDAAVA